MSAAETYEVAVTPTREETIDRILREITDAIEAVPDPDDEPTPRRRNEIIARRRSLKTLHSTVHTTRQPEARCEQRLAGFAGRRRQSAQELRRCEREVARLTQRDEVAERLDPMRRGRHLEMAAAYASAIAYLRGDPRGDANAGPLVAWRLAHPGESLAPLPVLDALIEQARKDLAPHRARLDAALQQWQQMRSSAA